MQLNKKYIIFRGLVFFALILVITIGDVYSQVTGSHTNVNLADEVKNKLQEVISPFSEDIEIKKIEYNRADDAWHIEGYGKSMDTIYGDFINSLVLSDYFQNVKPIKGYSKIDMDKAYFLISVELREPFEIVPSGSGKIRGKLIEIENGKPIANVKVRFLLDGNRYTQYGITDEEGVFVISIKPGEYYIVGKDVKPISYKDTIYGSTKASLSNGPGTKRKIVIEEDKIFDIKYPIPI